MKKPLVILLTLAASHFFSQDLTSKFGEVILPEAKDWCIGVDATKLIKNFGFDFTSNAQTINGKYFISATKAYRAGIRIGVNTWDARNMVEDRAARSTNTIIAYPAAVPLKQNSWHKFSTSVGLSLGIEKRKGKTRLQGLYGAEAAIYFSTTSDRFSYGNALDASPLNTIGVDDKDDAMHSPVFGHANNIDSVPAIQNALNNHARILERQNGLSFSIGVRAFIGAEFFFLPKMSLGGEFGWGMGYSITGRSETKYESIGQSNIPGATTPAVRQTIIDGAGNESFRLDNDNSNIFGGASASLKLNLYF